MAQTTALNPSLSLTEESVEQSLYQKVGGICMAIAILALVAALAGAGRNYPALFLSIIVGMFALGAISYAIPYYQGHAGIRNNGIMFKKMTNRGTIAWILAIALTGFYIIIYWFPWMFEGLIRIFDPLSKLLTNQPANQWFMYGAFYTLAVLSMGFRFIGRHSHNRYHVIRTFSVMF
nr:FeS-binding protein [Bacteroidota bacterium]